VHPILDNFTRSQTVLCLQNLPVIDIRDRFLQVRRLSTVSSVLAASGHVFRTTWKWYWQDEDDEWYCYDDSKADVTSEDIEQQFQSGSITTYIFKFTEMKQSQ
jgi:hypothetical protein